MSGKSKYSDIKHYIHLRRSTSDVEGSYLYEYIFDNLKNPGRYDRIRLSVDGNDISIKYLYYEGSFNEKLIIESLISIPINTGYSSFAKAENTLNRLKNKIITEIKDKNGTFQILFKHILYRFILDLYVYNGLKNYPEINILKSSLESIPLLKLIILKELNDYYFEAFNNRKEKNIFRNIDFDNFYDNYLNLSRFLANPQNERLFYKGGWVVRNKDSQSRHELDTQLTNLEARYLVAEKFIRLKSSKRKNNRSNPIEPANVKNIIKRYGVIDVLTLSSKKWWSQFLIFSIILLLASILFNIGIFDFVTTQKDITKFSENKYLKFSNNLFIYSSILFAAISIVSGIMAYKKFKFSAIPALYLPRMIVAVLSGWIMLLTAEELIKLDIGLRSLPLTVSAVFILLVTLIFMAFEIHNYAPNMRLGRVVRRTLMISALSFIVSYFFGFLVLGEVNKQFLSIGHPIIENSVEYMDSVANSYDSVIKKFEDKGSLKMKNNETYFIQKFTIIQGHYSISIFPNMLLFRSLIAMFIGIFLQLIIQDKTISEPI